MKALSDINMAGVSRLVNLPLPEAAGDSASKEYVDALAQGLKIKENCHLASATAENVDIADAPANLDGVAMVSLGRYLLKNQTLPVQNGIYIFNGLGSAMTRATDMAATTHAQGVYTFVTAGSTNASTQWVCTTEGPNDVVGTDALVFSLFNALNPVTYRDGLKRTSNYVDVDPGLGLSIAGGAGTSGKLNVHLDTVINSGNGGGLQIDVGSLGDGLSVKVDGTKVVLNASGQVTLGSGMGVAKYATDVGDGVNKDITVTHALNTTDVQVQVRAAADPKTVILVDWKVTGANTIQLNFKQKPASLEYRCVVVG